ncbi:MAG TPA: hypothetical protein VGB75_09575 [Jatrophihabitans sp.]|uniref:hypothetical protein n=1 Tax=Jatrophihabitans sp. TaxID=1932789 RepID=UPI002F21479C
MTTVSITSREGSSQTPRQNRRNVLGDGLSPYVSGGALAVIAAPAAGLTVAFPSLLHGVAVSNGNVRGTAVALLAVGLPVLIVAMIGTSRGSTRAFVVWLGTLGYLIYQAVLLCFATPMNNLFLLYVAYLGMAVWSTVMLLRATDLRAFAARLSDAVPARGIAAAALILVVLNAAAWLWKIVPATFSSRPVSVLDGTGLVVNPVYVQDLAIWLPLLTVAAVACWRRESWGLLITAAMLALFILESISVSVDQWFGSHADPTSPVSSMSMTPVFAVIAAITAGLLAWFLRAVDGAPG